MSLGVRENRREGDVVWGGESVALRLPDAGELARSYPADCRFVFSCMTTEDLSISAWSGDEWSTEVGSSFAVSLGDGLHWSRANGSGLPNPLADVTKLIRGENKSGPATGLLVQIKHGRGVMLDGVSADNRWCLPHILVVSDFPPDDL